MNLLQRICEKLTKHKLRRCEGESIGIEPAEYHYRCLICRLPFWNHKKPRRYKYERD